MFPEGDESSLPDPRHSTPKPRGILNLPLPTRSPYPFRSRSSKPSQDLPNTQLTSRPEDDTSFISRDDWTCLRLEIASLQSEICTLRLKHEELKEIRAELETVRLSSQNSAACHATSHPTNRPTNNPSRNTAPARSASNFASQSVSCAREEEEEK